MARTGWKWLEIDEMTMTMLQNQMGWPYHSLDCVWFLLATVTDMESHFKTDQCCQ